jgi:hypothetical protein
MRKDEFNRQRAGKRKAPARIVWFDEPHLLVPGFSGIRVWGIALDASTSTLAAWLPQA